MVIIYNLVNRRLFNQLLEAGSVLLVAAYLGVRDLLILGLYSKYSRYVDQLAQRTALNQYVINILAWGGNGQSPLGACHLTWNAAA